MYFFMLQDQLMLTNFTWYHLVPCRPRYWVSTDQSMSSLVFCTLPALRTLLKPGLPLPAFIHWLMFVGPHAWDAEINTVLQLILDTYPEGHWISPFCEAVLLSLRGLLWNNSAVNTTPKFPFRNSPGISATAISHKAVGSFKSYVNIWFTFSLSSICSTSWSPKAHSRQWH